MSSLWQPPQFPDAAFTASAAAVSRALGQAWPRLDAVAALLSPAAEAMLEDMAAAAAERTLRHFGRARLLFTPLYVANYCENRCRYCGYAAHVTMPRRKLSLEEVAAQGERIAATGLRHLLLLTGEAPRRAGVDYIVDCVRLLAPRFPGLALEVFPLATAHYGAAVEAGVTGLTLYQETYDPEVYRAMHPAGPKADYAWRLDAPARAAHAGMPSITLGALLGLAPWRQDVLALVAHARYLLERFPGVEIGVSLPRLRPHAGGFAAPHPVADRQFVQAILALRLALPCAGITLSTREAPRLRDGLVGLAVTKLSAGVRTSVGEVEGSEQFVINDTRSVAEVAAMLRSQGLQPVFKDWQPLVGKAVPRAA